MKLYKPKHPRVTNRVARTGRNTGVANLGIIVMALRNKMICWWWFWCVYQLWFDMKSRLRKSENNDHDDGILALHDKITYLQEWEWKVDSERVKIMIMIIYSCHAFSFSLGPKKSKLHCYCLLHKSKPYVIFTILAYSWVMKFTTSQLIIPRKKWKTVSVFSASVNDLSIYFLIFLPLSKISISRALILTRFSKLSSFSLFKKLLLEFCIKDQRYKPNHTFNLGLDVYWF